MATKLYVRGASADVAVVDLGITVAQGPSWTVLNASSPNDAEGDSGQFTARELRDSFDLFDLVAAGTLEWSKDGSVVEAAGDYRADYMITEDFTDDFFNLEDGGLVLPHSDTLPASGVEGDTYWKDDSDEMYVYDGDDWQLIGGEIAESTHEPTGFENRTDSQFSFVDGTRTFTIQPVSSNYDIFFSGRKVTKTGAENVIITDTEGVHFIYFDDADDTLKSTTTFDNDLITTDVFVAAIYWDADNDKHVIFAEERHGITMDGQTHSYLHNIFGAQWSDGLALGNMTVDDDGSVNSHTQFAVTDGTIYDEDIEIDINDGTPQDLDPIGQIPILYKESADGDWRKKTADDYPLIQDGTVGYDGANDLIAYNEWTGSTWQLTEVATSGLMLMHYFATNDVEEPVIGIVGQEEYATLAAAQSAATTEINSIVTAGLPAKEFVALATVIFQTATDYTNTPKARIVSTAEGDDYVDWRFTVVNPSGGVSTGDHGNLTGLGDDDHIQYFDLDGDKIRNVVDSGNGVTWNGDFDAASGIITLPQSTDVAGTFTSAGEGDIAWDSDDDQLYLYDGNSWVTIAEMVSGVLDHNWLLNIGTNSHDQIDTHIADGNIHGPYAHSEITGVGADDHHDQSHTHDGDGSGTIDHDVLNGLGDDDHSQYFLNDGDLTRNEITGGADFSSASGLVLPNGTDTSSQTSVEGNVFWDSDDDELYVYNGSEWVNIGSTIASGVIDHGELAGLGDDDHTQYLNETRHDALPADNPHSVTFTQAVTADGGTDISAVEAETLTDGSNADLLHTHDTSHAHAHSEITGVGADDHHDELHTIVSHSDTDATGAELNTLTDGSNADSLHEHDHGALSGIDDDDHTQYVLIDGDLTRNQFSDGGLDLSSASGLIVPTGTDRTGLATVEGNIMWDTDDDMPWFYDGTEWVSVPMILSGLVLSTDHGGLFGLDDDDHPQYTAWEQDETVTGIWTFDPVDVEPNLILDPRPSAPTNNLVDGAISIVGGLLYAYDGTRSKWLSVDRTTYFGGRNGNATNIYLRVADNVATSATGIRMLRDGTITGLFAQTEGSESWTFEVRDSAGSVLTSLVISAADGDEDSTINIDVSAGDEIRLYANGTGIIRPVAGFEVAWRI